MFGTLTPPVLLANDFNVVKVQLAKAGVAKPTWVKPVAASAAPSIARLLLVFDFDFIEVIAFIGIGMIHKVYHGLGCSLVS